MKRHLKSCVDLRSGFSLVELLLTLALLGLAAAAGYSALRTAAVRLDGIIDRAVHESDEAVAAAIIARDIRSACLSGDDGRTYFSGHARGAEPQLDFTRAAVDPNIMEVEYAAKKNSQTGRLEIWRRTNTAETGEPLLGDVEAFELRYFDGNAWQPSWGWDDEYNRRLQGIRGLPAAVAVQINGLKIIVPVMTAVLNKKI